MATKSYDVIMVGGGIMGCATAYYLLKYDPKIKVALVEKDPTYEKAATPLSDGNIRIQFNVKENIQISIYGLEVLKTFATDMAVGDEKPDVGFRQQGNLFIASEASQEEAREGLALQQSLGCQVEWLTPPQVKEVYPFYNLEGCAGGTLGHKDGSMSPLDFLLAYKKKAVSMGAEFMQAEVSEVLRDGNHVTGVKLTNGDVLTAGSVVNSAGPWAPKVAMTAGVNLPILPTKRQVFVLETEARSEKVLPAIFFPSGLYLFHEGAGHFTCGKSLSTDPVGYDDFEWDRRVFEDQLWEELVSYLPAFDRLKVTQGWAGLYEMNTFDGNAILGEWPELKGFYLENGFSGHGFQQGPAVGRYTAELVLGKPLSLDLSGLNGSRILENKPNPESKRRII